MHVPQPTRNTKKKVGEKGPCYNNHHNMIALSTSTFEFIPNMQPFFKDENPCWKPATTHEKRKSNLKHSSFNSTHISVTLSKWMAAYRQGSDREAIQSMWVY